MNAHMDSCAISLLTLYLLNANDIFLSVHLNYLAYLLTFVVSLNHLELVILVDLHGEHFVLLLQLLGEWGLDLPAHVRGGIEVAFADFAVV